MNGITENFVLKGNIVYSDESRKLHCQENAYLVCINHQCEGVFPELPEQYEKLKQLDMGNRLIIPGITDLHLHAPQYPFRGLGMDLELLEWLNTNTFPEEEKYFDLSYAKAAYAQFSSDLNSSVTTRACIFATVHKDATLLLMELLEQTGLITCVGRVNMDRNCSVGLCEESAQSSIEDTQRWVREARERFHLTRPILTPRFIPTCSDELMRGLSLLQKKYHLPVQSHLSENLSEIAWVKELVPGAACYGAAYNDFGLFGDPVPTIMAHCVYSTEEEIRLMKEKGVYIAHCPESNLNIASGIAPVRKYLSEGLQIGLATDVAGGSSLSMLRSMAYAIQASKMYWRLIDQRDSPLKFEEVFYLATLGGGGFFGKVGSFLKGYEFDAVVIEDEKIKSPKSVTIKERAERMIYLPEDIKVYAKFVNGRKLY